MAALVEGQQYGLSSQGNLSSNKTLVFVKLTDSALRAIEDYVKTRASSSQKPSIQFKSNNGVINLPKSDNGCNKQSYNFSLSNVEAEGPQGGFECLRQSGLRSLESLGCMLYKMQIHANEDSYEKTRVKMAAVEKENKKFCTKEIKPSGPYLEDFLIPDSVIPLMPLKQHLSSRKVKVKRPNAVIPPKPSSPTLSLSKPIPKPPVSSNSIVTSGSQFHSSTNNSRQVPINKGVKTSEIMRKTVRERIIHLLALRPYKKPELLARLLRDGIKEKEKKGMSAILCQIAVLKDNAYHLANHAWSEVHDNWPFYSAEEAETIRKRRRPPANTQNENRIPSPSITQPNTSPVQKRSSEYEVHGNKKQRISHYNKVDNASSNSNSSFPSRSDYSGTVSGDKTEDASDHFFKKEPVDGNVRTNLHANVRQKSPDVNSTFWSNGVHSQKNSVNNESGKHSTHDALGLSQKNCPNDDVKDSNQSSFGVSQKSYAYDMDKPSHNPPLGISQKNNITHGHHQSSGAGQRGFISSDTEKSNCHNTFSASQKTREVDRSDHYTYANQTHKNYSSSETDKQVQHVRCLPNLRVESSMRPADSSQTIVARVSPDSNSHIQGAQRFDFYGDKPVTNGFGYNTQSTRHENAHHRKNQSKVSSTTNGSGGSSPRTSPDSQDSMDYCGSENEDHSLSSGFDGAEFLKQYGVIASLDQRARYKADFNAEYEEYRYLHSKMKNVSKRFAALEDQLNAFEEGSPEWHRIKGQIYREYEDNKHDPKYQGVRRKFNFLHKKLSHIKRLVMEYDNAQAVKS